MTKRYQFHLRKESVSIIDRVVKEIGATRSEVIRRVVDEFAEELDNRIQQPKDQTEQGLNILQKMAGAVSLGSKISGRDHDKIYEVIR